MIKTPRNTKKTALLLLLLVTVLAACGPAATPLASPTAAIQIQTVEVTQEVTHVVTAESTVQVDVPVTETPTATLVPTATPNFSPTPRIFPTVTPTVEAPRVEIQSVPGSEMTGCWYGPSTAYLYKYGLPKGVWMRVIGRNEDGTWVTVKAGDDRDTNACWVQTELVKFLSGNIQQVPVYWIALPYSVLYLPPVSVSASREGNEVTIWWQPIWMTEDDYRGYLVEAWVCQGGKLVFQPLGYVTTYLDNQVAIRDKAILSVKVTDEPGCDVPSRARLYAVEKHGYTNYIMVPWPAH